MRVNKAWSGVSAQKVISRKRWSAVCAVVLMTAAALVSQTVGSPTPSRNRITQEVTSGAMVTIAGTVHPLTRRATDLGEVSSEMAMDSLTLNVSLSADQETALDALLAAQQDPKSPQYHQWLTQEEYGARFGLTDADLSKVTQWLTSQGFTVKGVAPSRNLITFSGTAAQAEQAFGTRLHQYELDGRTHFANATELKIPAALSGMVTHVGGLSSFRPKPHAIKRANPDFTSQLSGNHYLAPGDWATIYDVTSIYTASATCCTGAGIHVGIVGQTYFPQADIDNFRAAAGLSATKLTMECISTSSLCGAAHSPANEDVDDVVEADLDVEWSGGIAKNATVDFIYAAANDPNLGVFDALTYAITTYKVSGAVVPVLSMSYGVCEMQEEASFETSFDMTYSEEAAAQGQTILNSSGDDGAGCVYTTDNEPPPTTADGPIVSWPASSPNVTAVGGTTFSGDGSDLYGDQYWNGSTTTDIVNSAIKYIPETSWNDTSESPHLSSSGGGVSATYSIPSWQVGLISGQTSWRLVPDVAFSASPNHDGGLVCTENFPSTETGAPTSNPGSTCSKGFRFASANPNLNNSLSVYGGTSFSTPSFAGMLTLLVQKYGPMGNVNPTLYSLAKNPTTYAAVFHDITTGNNEQPCNTGTPDCVSNLVGYAATTGYDLVTGLGSIDGGALYTALASGSGGTVTSGNFTLSSATTSISLADGGSTPVGLTLASSGYAGTVTFQTSVTLNGVTSILVTASAPQVTLVSNGSGNATLTITAGSSAEKYAPGLPWRSGGALAFAVVLGAPFTLRRKKQALAVLLVALTISAAGIMMACGGGGSSSQASKTQTPSARTYYVTVTATGSGGVTNPQPVMITVTVP